MDILQPGYVLLRGGVPQALVDRANHAIDVDLRERYDPARQVEYDERSACPDLRGSPVIDGLLEPVRPALDRWLGWDRITDRGHGQLAIRWAGNHDVPIEPTWHIDGIATAGNGLQGSELHSYTALVGVFLTATPGPFSGNFTVWPGSWRALSAWYRGDPGRMHSGLPEVDPGEPRQLQTRPGDVVIANYLLAHAAAVNTSDVQRRAVFFRLKLDDLEAHRYQRVCDPWDGWSV